MLISKMSPDKLKATQLKLNTEKQGQQRQHFKMIVRLFCEVIDNCSTLVSTERSHKDTHHINYLRIVIHNSSETGYQK